MIKQEGIRLGGLPCLGYTLYNAAGAVGLLKINCAGYASVQSAFYAATAALCYIANILLRK